jgi:hypothetical protein
MAKDTYYFSHDYYARKDPKCVALIQNYGAAGYGIYWSLIEIMYEQGGKIKKFPALYSALAKEFGISVEELTKQIEAMLHDYELLQQDATHLWSDSVLDRLELRDEKRSVKASSGRLGGLKSGESRRNKKDGKQNEAPLQSNEANEQKERKGKERKVEEYSTTTTEKKFNGLVVYDAEKTILENVQELERICMAASKNMESGKESLRKYHLFLEEREAYPKGRKAIFAGFEKWLLNEKKFNSNGSNQRAFTGNNSQSTSSKSNQKTNDIIGYGLAGKGGNQGWQAGDSVGN